MCLVVVLLHIKKEYAIVVVVILFALFPEYLFENKNKLNNTFCVI